MRYTRLKQLIPLIAALCCLTAILTQQEAQHAHAADDAPAPAEQAPAPAPAEPIDPIAQAIAKFNGQDHGVQVNPKGLYLDIDAKVCLRSGEFLEMFACTPDTREHESILVLDVKPSTIHFGLLLLGQEPGKPLRYDRAFNPPKLIRATGPEVQVFIVQSVAGKERETPANQWIKDNKTDEIMKGNTWLFAGSVFADIEDKEVYLADLNGSVISLVNFGDDLLTLPNTMTQENESHGKTWAPRTQAIPKVGTQVTLRLRVKAPKPEPKADADADDKPKPAQDEPAHPAEGAGR